LVRVLPLEARSKMRRRAYAAAVRCELEGSRRSKRVLL
jgi:hypothetical protein